MNTTTIKLTIGDRVKVKMAREVEGKVHRVGERSATVQVEGEFGAIIISSPLAAIERVSPNGEEG